MKNVQIISLVTIVLMVLLGGAVIPFIISNAPSEHNSLTYEIDGKSTFSNGDVCVYIRDQEVDINKKNSWMSINNESSVEITTYKKVYNGYKSTLKIYFNDQLLYEYDGDFSVSNTATGKIFSLSISSEDMVVLFTKKATVKIIGGDQ